MTTPQGSMVSAPLLLVTQALDGVESDEAKRAGQAIRHTPGWAGWRLHAPDQPPERSRTRNG